MDKKPFACHLCPKMFKLERHYDKHLKSHTESKSFFCSICQNEVCDRTDHLRTRESGKLFECEECKIGFPSKDAWDIHLLTHERKKPPFVCNVCKKRFSSEYCLKRHSQQHKGKISKSFSCKICGEKFDAKATLMLHRLVHETVCYICKKQFPTKRSLAGHIPVHNRKCVKTEKVFSADKPSTCLEDSLQTQENPFFCGKCGKGFADEAAAENHLCMSIKDKFTCDQCSSVFSRSSSLKSHTNFVHNRVRAVACDRCKREFFNEFHLDLHRRAGSCPYFIS